MVVVDDRGKPTGEGLVEFSRKSGAAFAQRKCTDGCYFITASLKPIIVDTYEILDEVDGFPERNIIKKSQDYYSARNVSNFSYENLCPYVLAIRIVCKSFDK